jgi:hypothetical protein
MNRTQLEHVIRAASQISGDSEIVVIGSQAIHAHDASLPAIAFQSQEADVYPRNHPERAEDVDGAIGELSPFHRTHGYYAHGVSPETAILPAGWEKRLVPLANANTGDATGLCLEAHDLALSKYAAGRDKDIAFNRALVRHGVLAKSKLLARARAMPVDDATRSIINDRTRSDFALANPGRKRRARSHRQP